MSDEHLDGAVALQRACFPAPFPEELLWTRDHLTRHLELFPKGQFIALDGDLVVASASATRISEENWQAHRSWDETVGGPFLTTFDPHGTTLYGLDISVHPDYRGQGLGRMLYLKRFDLVTNLGFLRYGTACRLPDFRAFQNQHAGSTVEEYADNVVRGKAQDRTLTPLLRYGLTFRGVIHEYMDDYESDNSAALLEWRP
jgi:GNAT superfamily N-acetyltransferase